MAVAEIRRADTDDEPTVPAPKPSSVCITSEVYVARYWKREPNVASRYELELAIDRLIDRRLIEIVDGKISLRRGAQRKFEPIPAAERWQREDDDLRSFCEQMSVHESRSMKMRDELELLVGQSNFEASVLRSTPRRGIDRYVLRELQVGDRPARAPYAPADYSILIHTILSKGGWEFVSEEPRRRTIAKKGSRRA